MADFCPATMKTISYAEAAALIGIKLSTIRKWSMHRNFPKIQLNARVVRIPQDKFLEWAYGGGAKEASDELQKRYPKKNKEVKTHEA